jgi:hypothetical protein
VSKSDEEGVEFDYSMRRETCHQPAAKLDYEFFQNLKNCISMVCEFTSNSGTLPASYCPEEAVHLPKGGQGTPPEDPHNQLQQ